MNNKKDLVLLKYSKPEFAAKLEAETKQLESEYKRTKNMILMEGAVFFLVLILGLWYVQRGFKNEVRLAKQQRNFLLSITHELKSPIAAIRLILETFQKRDLNRQQIQKFSSNALKDVKRLYELVENLLLAARVESNDPWTFDKLDLVDLIGNIIERFRGKYPEINISSNFYEDEIFIKGDEMAVSLIIINLLENAVKYSANNPDIRIVVGHSKRTVYLEIKDKGIGIPDAEKPLIFDKFYRIGSEDTRKTKGTGLGLYIVKQIVESHSGNISVKNNKPTGSIFKIALPLLNT